MNLVFKVWPIKLEATLKFFIFVFDSTLSLIRILIISIAMQYCLCLSQKTRVFDLGSRHFIINHLVPICNYYVLKIVVQSASLFIAFCLYFKRHVCCANAFRDVLSSVQIPHLPIYFRKSSHATSTLLFHRL